MRRNYPVQPLVEAGAILIRDNSLLLVKRSKPPAEGLWNYSQLYLVRKVGETS